MNMPSSKYLKNKADRRLESGKEPKQVVVVYAAITLISALLITVIRYTLAEQIAHTGGLQNIGIRSVLSTANQVLPILNAVLILCLNLGYTAAMLRIARRQYASARTLKAGVERLGVLIRKTLLMGLLYFGAGMGAFYLSVALFMLTPLSNRFSEIAMPLVSSGNYSPEVLIQDSALLLSLTRAMIPLFIVYGIFVLCAIVPLLFRYRLTDYFLIDKPAQGALACMRDSKYFMIGHWKEMFLLDLSFWWVWLLQLAVSALAYADVWLAKMGVDLQLPAAVTFFAPFILYLIADFAFLYFIKNKVAVTYALAYDSLIPHAEHNEDNGVVLGNIFQM